MKGIFIASNNTNGFIEPEALKANVFGASLQFEWASLQNQNGTLNTTFLNTKFIPNCNSVISAGKKIKLAIMTGNKCSAYLQPIEQLHFPEIRETTNQPIDIWLYNVLDSRFLTKWLYFLDLFFAWLKTTSIWAHVVAIVPTGFGRDTIELRLPCQPNSEAKWSSKGYTTQAIVNMWKPMVDKFHAQGRELAVPIITGKVFPFSTTANNTTIPLRDCVTGKGGYVYTTVLQATAGTPKIVTDCPKIGFQLAAKYFNKPIPNQNIETALRNGISKGAKFIEVFPPNAIYFKGVVEKINGEMV